MPSTELLVDTENDPSNEDLYFISPENLNQLRFVRPSSFSRATIRNCHVFLTFFLMNKRELIKQI